MRALELCRWSVLPGKGSVENAVQAREIRAADRASVRRGSALQRDTFLGAVVAAVLAVAVAVAGFLLHLPLSAAEPLELLLVLLASLYLGLMPASVASVVAALCLDFFFTLPLFRFTVADPQNWIALATFETIALIVCRLSSQVQVHATKATEQQHRAMTLYQLSRSILYFQQQRPTAEQLAPLIRELVGVDEASFWTTLEDSHHTATPTSETVPSAYDVYLTARDRDDAATRTSTRVLRLGVKAVGGMTLRGGTLDPLMADAVASLSALAFERAHATRREGRAAVERDTEQLRTAVLDGLAHGFKTPLTAIQTASSGLLAVGKLTGMQQELVSIIDDRATMLSQLTTQLLQTAALDAKQIRLHRKAVSLVELLEKIVREQPADDQSRMVVQASPTPVEDLIDVPLIELALQQLLDNAAKYSTPHTDIAIGLLHKEEETVISVENAGGADFAARPEEKERIFERFYRGAQIGYGPAGTGIGLSIVKKVAEAHGGRAWVEGDGIRTRVSLSVARFQGERHA